MENGRQGRALQSVNNIRKLCKRAWWVFLLGGVASVIFGILAFICLSMWVTGSTRRVESLPT